MSGSARIQDVEALAQTRAMLAKFAEEASLTLVSVDADIARFTQWLTLDRPMYWKRRVRELEDVVEAAKAEIRRKQIVAAPEPASVVDERKRLNRAKAKLEDALKRQEAVRRWAPAWEREAMLYKGGCAPLTQAIYGEIPRAITRLSRMTEKLEEYLRLSAHAPEVAARPAEADDGDAGSGSWWAEFAGPDYRGLRSHVPEERDRAVPSEMALSQLEWSAGQPSDDDAGALRQLGLTGEPPAPEATMAVSWRAVKEQSIFAVRVAPATSGDSGWYIGPVEQPGATGGVRVCRVGEFTAQLPAMSAVLGLGRGALVVVTRGVIKAVLDAQDRDVWSPAGAAGDGATL